MSSQNRPWGRSGQSRGGWRGKSNRSWRGAGGSQNKRRGGGGFSGSNFSQNSWQDSGSESRGGNGAQPCLVSSSQRPPPRQPVITTLLPGVPCPFKGWHLYMTQGYSEHSNAVARVNAFKNFFLRSTTTKDREAIWTTSSFKVSLKELVSDPTLQATIPTLLEDALAAPHTCLTALGLAMHQILCEGVEEALRKDTVELLNLTLAQQNNTTNNNTTATTLHDYTPNNNTTTNSNTTATTLHDYTPNNNTTTNNNTTATPLHDYTPHGNNDSGSFNISRDTPNNSSSSISEASIKAAMPEVKVPLVSARLHDDRDGNITPLRDLKANCYGRLVCVSGTVVRVASVKQQCVQLAFSCQVCLAVFGFTQPDARYSPPSQCSSEGCLSRSFTALRSHALTLTVDWQTIRVQEGNTDTKDGVSTSEQGRVPRCVECHLTRDLVDCCIPGDLVTITGTVEVEQCGESSGRQGDTCMFMVYVAACGVDTCKADPATAAASAFTIADYYQIRAIHGQPSLFRLLVHSLCPAIYGQDLVKAGLLLCLFGGSGGEQQPGSGVTVRGESHILIVGDPGLGKSQMLQACASVAPRGVYVCGNTATSAGLTVSLTREAGSGGDYSLEAGALVMADRGVCCIDEFDKMTLQHHQALLEGMEQQHISVAKGGLVCRLPARTAVLAAANPVQGHYNKAKTVAENLRINAPLLSRFDLLFILLDSPDEELDSRLSRHVMALHSERPSPAAEGGGGVRGRDTRGGGDGAGGALNTSVLAATDAGEKTLGERLRYGADETTPDPLPHPTLRKYICYARRYVRPSLTAAAASLLQTFYLELRSLHHHNSGTAPPITTRHLEALVRLAQARAKCELREEATAEDARDVVELMRHSMHDTYTDDLGHLHFDRSSHSSASSNRSKTKRFLATLQRHSDSLGKSVFTMEEMKRLAQQTQIEVNSLTDLVDGLNQQGFLIKKGNKVYQLMTAG